MTPEELNKAIAILIEYGSGGTDPAAKWCCPSCGEQYADPQREDAKARVGQHAQCCRWLLRDVTEQAAPAQPAQPPNPAPPPTDSQFAGLVRVLREYHALWPHNAASTATHAQLVAYMLAASRCWNERIAPLVKEEWYRQLEGNTPDAPQR